MLKSKIESYFLVTHPCEIVMETMLEKELGINDVFYGLPTMMVHYFLLGKATIEPFLAKRLSEKLGASEEFWLNLNDQYYKECMRLQRIIKMYPL